MKTKKSYPMYIAPFADRWVVQRRRYGGVVTNAETKKEAIEKGEQEAKRYARIYGNVQILVQNDEGKFREHKIVTPE